MSVSPFDSTLYGALLSDPPAAALFSAEAEVSAILRFETALAEAQAEAGVIPPQAAEEIAKALSSVSLDPAELAEATARDGVPLPGLIAALRERIGGEAASYLHWGATSQDAMDSGLVLRLRELLALLEERLEAVMTPLARLADEQRASVMAGRTRMQQATPVTFGLKAAGWLAPLLRHGERLEELRGRLLMLSFGGAAGTLSVLGDKGPAVEAALASRLSLAVPAMPWHSQRDGLLELGSWLSLVTAGLGKMGQDLILLAQNEVGEVRLLGGGSSTMPNKVNPVGPEVLIALTRHNAAQLGALHQAAMAEQERGGAAWMSEWLTLPSMAVAASAALGTAAALLEGLEVRPERMRENLERSRGLTLAEAATFALCAHMPKGEAQALVKQACAEAIEEGGHLLDLLAARSGVPLNWQALKEPARQTGSAELFIDRVLAAWKEHRG